MYRNLNYFASKDLQGIADSVSNGPFGKPAPGVKEEVR